MGNNSNNHFIFIFYFSPAFSLAPPSHHQHTKKCVSPSSLTRVRPSFVLFSHFGREGDMCVVAESSAVKCERETNPPPRPPSYYFINYSFSFTKLIFIWRTPEHNFWFFRKTPPRVYHFLNFLFSNWIISFSVKLFSCSFLFHVQMLCTELTVSPLCTYPPFYIQENKLCLCPSSV
jgi:hypothetical protein